MQVEQELKQALHCPLSKKYPLEQEETHDPACKYFGDSQVRQLFTLVLHVLQFELHCSQE
jgi:hypothetical protein